METQISQATFLSSHFAAPQQRPETFAEQTRQTLRNIDAALIEAGASMTDIVRANYIITDRDD